MPSATDRLDFAPPRDAGSIRAFGLALLAHILLIAALTWGVNWKRSDQSVSFEAELWSSVPQAAAPKLVEPPPPPPPPPAPEPVSRTPEVKAAPPAPDVDIALEQEKKRKLLQQQKEREAQEKKLDKQKAEKAEALAKKEKEKELKAREELAKRKAVDDAKKAEARKEQARDQEKQKLSEAAAKKLRDDNLKRMMGQAGATGGATSTGSAQKASGPSASYGGKVRAKVKPNVVFTDDIAGNPTAEVEVRTLPDGTIVGQRLVKSSGNKAWDEAVLKAIVRTETMPRDVDGRVPTPMILEFRPKD
jgi:colicin import membrane protein